MNTNHQCRNCRWWDPVEDLDNSGTCTKTDQLDAKIWAYPFVADQVIMTTWDYACSHWSGLVSAITGLSFERKKLCCNAKSRLSDLQLEEETWEPI